MGYWLKVAALVGLVLLAFEVGSRLAIGHAPRNRIDPRYDSLPRPHEPVVQSSEGLLRARTNELGHLDAPMPEPLPPDGVIVIGDSFTEARQVALAERFTDRLGARLGRRVYNVGHTGWSPLNAIAFLEAEAARFRPSDVIVQVSGNDLGDMVARRRMHVAEAEGGRFEIVLPDRTKQGIGRQINAVKNALARSALAGNLVTSGLVLLGIAEGGAGGGAGGEISCDRPAPLAIRALPELLERLRRAHPRVHLLYLPMLDYQAGCTDRCGEAQAALAAAARAAGVPFVDVTAAVCARFAETRQPLHGFWNTMPGTGHLNAAAHEIVAAALATHLRPP